MADSDKQILITPATGTTSDPSIVFTGGGAGTANTITLNILDDGTLSFEGTSGQLFSISDDMTGTIFSVSDISGIPSIEVQANGMIRLAEFSGHVLLGQEPDNQTDILQANGLDHTKRIKDFSEDEIAKIRKSIDESYTVEGDLRRVVSQNIKRLKDLGCYRGLRHRRQLPTRGQRTHTNARTRKGKAVAIAGKKKVTK